MRVLSTLYFRSSDKRYFTLVSFSLSFDNNDREILSFRACI